jgi:regulator of protease activity HflC (stomatin/prohibitin superfamily)
VRIGLAVIATRVATFFAVEQRTAAVVQRLAKFVRETGPGLHVKVPFIDRVIGRISGSCRRGPSCNQSASR